MKDYEQYSYGRSLSPISKVSIVPQSFICSTNGEYSIDLHYNKSGGPIVQNIKIKHPHEKILISPKEPFECQIIDHNIMAEVKIYNIEKDKIECCKEVPIFYDLCQVSHLTEGSSQFFDPLIMK